MAPIDTERSGPTARVNVAAMERSRESDAVQAGHFIDPDNGAIVPPLQPSSTYARDGNYELIGEYLYNRYGTPSHRPLEEVVARLDGGAGSLSFASGLSAFSALVETVPGGSGVVAPRVMYYGGQQWLRRLDERGRIRLTLFDQADPDSLAASVGEDTDLVWIETPVNPTWDVVDIAEAARVAHDAGAILAIDATASPVTTRPIELGADYVFHSATKYYNGHSDIGGGLLIASVSDERWEEVRWVRTHQGAILGPFEAWLLLRGMRTLFLRVDRASASAMAIATHFEGHPSVERVLYPGLESHPGHEVARRQMDRGFGAMMSLLVEGGRADAHRVATSTRVFVPATSLGGVESLIEHRTILEPPTSMVPENLLRLSIGIEPVDELIADLEQALA